MQLAASAHPHLAAQHHTHHHHTAATATSCSPPAGATLFAPPPLARLHTATPAPHQPTRPRAVAVAAAPASPAAPTTLSTLPPGPKSARYFDAFLDTDPERLPVWRQLRWCSSWQEVQQLYDACLAANAEVMAAAASRLYPQQQPAPAVAGDDTQQQQQGQGPQQHAAASGGGAGGVRSGVPLLSRDETYAFLVQLQDFFHAGISEQERLAMQAFRCRLVSDISVHINRMSAEQLEAMCCVSAVSKGATCLTKDRAGAVQARMLKLLAAAAARGSALTPSDDLLKLHMPATPANARHAAEVSINRGQKAAARGAAAAAAAAAAPPQLSSQQAPARLPAGSELITPALNTLFALYDHGYLPQVKLLQALFRLAVDHCTDVTPTQWQGLHRVARKFRFLVDDHWLDDLRVTLNDPVTCSQDFGRLVSILGVLSSCCVNGTMEPLDTRVQVVVELVERRFDMGRSLLTGHQLCQFTQLLWDMHSFYSAKWLGFCCDWLGSCSSHLAGLTPDTLMLATDLVITGRGWDERRLLSKLLNQLASSYAKAPPRITGKANYMRQDVAAIVDWLAAKLAAVQASERAEVSAFLEPVIARVVEAGMGQLRQLEPARIPPLIQAVAGLGYSPSPEWQAEALQCLSTRAEQIEGSTLLALLRVSHSTKMRLPHDALDAVCLQHARVLPLMRAVDLLRLLDAWVVDHYVPSPQQLAGFFEAVVDVFGLPDISLVASSAIASGSGGSLASVSIDLVGQQQQPAAEVSATAVPPPPQPAASAAGVGTPSAGAASPAEPPVAAPAVPAHPTPAVLGSLEGRPKGVLLQPFEAMSMGALLDQYRELLRQQKKSELVIIMNRYRNVVTAALHDMKRSSSPSKSSRLVQVLRSGGGVL